MESQLEEVRHRIRKAEDEIVEVKQEPNRQGTKEVKKR